MPALTPSEVHTVFVDAFNRGDVDALVALYEPDAVLIERGRPAIGRDAIRQAYRDLIDRRGHMVLETRSAVASSDGLAVLHGAWTLELPDPPGAGRTVTGLSTEVVRRQPDGAWLFVIDEPYTPLAI